MLVHYLAAELDQRVSGRPLEDVRLDPEVRRAALVLDRDAVLFDLHPTAGTVRIGAAPALPRSTRTARWTTLAAVAAPPDERLLCFDLAATGGPADRPRRIVVELLANQWNLLVLDAAGRIIAALWRRTAGERRLHPGALYVPPPAGSRRGVTAPVDPAEWHAVLAPVPAGERLRALVAGVAYTSPINGAAILGDAARVEGSGPLDDAYRRYVALAALPAPAPQLLTLDTRVQPYPLPLPGVAGRPFPSLLDAIAAATGATVPEAAPTLPAALMDRLRSRLARLDARQSRLARELAGAAPEAERLRRQADLLLSQLHRARKGSDHVELPDFAGGTVRVPLDPALAPVENAHRLYDTARKRERAAERLPALLGRAETDRERVAALLARAEAGEDVRAEVEAVVGGAAVGEPRPGGRVSAQPGRALPYRRYRTSGGLEVRVGRGSRANDDLTFHHAAPEDIWLHARDVAGAHVILRWGVADSNPPARDLAEAAVLAALHSRARTAGTAAVDWTRRKYVRKPRKSPPGRVAIERARTVFVEPDEAVERRLRVGME